MGGIETHCQELYPRLAQRGVKAVILGRKAYTPQVEPYDYRGVRIVPIYAPRTAGLEAFVHSVRSVLKVLKLRPDIVHLHAIGPSAIAPIFRLFGLKVVYTHHGQDYNRAKWGACAKLILRLSEYLGTKFSNKVIVISEYLEKWLQEKYGCKRTALIHNGVNLPKKLPEDVAAGYLEKFGLVGKRYIFALGRFVEEKGFHDLIAAYKKSNLKDVKLVLAGKADHESEYSRRLCRMADDAGVVLTGFIHGEELQAIFENSSLFVIPSYHEGLPIALLEALSYNRNVIASDIPANTEVPLPRECFFHTGNIDELADKLVSFVNNPAERNFQQIILENYNWENIADQTFEVYKELTR